MSAQAQISSEFTLKQRRFIHAYVGEARGNGAEAVRLAGYDTESVETQRAIAYENLTKPYIRAEIERILDAQAMHAGEIVAELSDIGRAPWRDFVKLKLSDDGDVVDAKIVLGDKVRALSELAKIRKMTGTEQPQQAGNTYNIVVVTEKVTEAVQALMGELGLDQEAALALYREVAPEQVRLLEGGEK